MFYFIRTRVARRGEAGIQQQRRREGPDAGEPGQPGGQVRAGHTEHEEGPQAAPDGGHPGDLRGPGTIIKNNLTLLCFFLISNFKIFHIITVHMSRFHKIFG